MKTVAIEVNVGDEVEIRGYNEDWRGIVEQTKGGEIHLRSLDGKERAIYSTHEIDSIEVVRRARPTVKDELLAALKAVDSDLASRGWPTNHDVRMLARAAIARAEKEMRS